MARPLLAFASLGLLLAPALAAAQGAGGTTPPAGGAPAGGAPAGGAPAGDDGKTVDLPEDDTTVADPSGMQENPDAPPGTTTGIAVVAPPPPPEAPKGFPIEDALRPITLPALMSEAGLDFRNNIDPYDGNATLRGRFGITRQWQIGLEYTVGGFFDDLDTAEDKVKFNTGKSLGLDVTYLVRSWLGVRVALPFYMDPFAMGVTIGAPMKFRLGKKFAFGGMGDFLSIKIHNFVPSTTDERVNDVNTYLVDSNSATSDGSLRFSGFATYQAKPNIAVGGMVGWVYEDFDDTEVPYSLHVKAQYSTSNKLDFGGVFGFGDLSDARNSIQLNVYGQLRI
jgi:hypothetical protein